MQKAKYESIWIGLIAFAALAVRIYFSKFMVFGVDESRIVNQALDWVLDGELSPVGAAVVYTRTRIPGSLLPILVGAPLFLSDGDPIGAQILVAVLMWITTGLMFWIGVRLFPRISPVILALWIFLAPWGFLLTPIWNPSYVPILFVAFAWGWSRILFATERKSVYLGSFAVALSFWFTLQLHLSVVVLAIFSFFSFVWAIRMTRWKAMIRFPSALLGGLGSGTALGMVTLIPFLLSPKNGGAGAFLGSNIVNHGNDGARFFRFFFRLLTFPTPEVFRFFGEPKFGIIGGITVLFEHGPWAIFLVPLMFVGILVGVFCGLRFFWIGGRKFGFFRTAGVDRMAWLDFTVFNTVLATGCSFWFSSGAPAAHTFWILYAAAFYIVARGIPPRLAEWASQPRNSPVFAFYAVSTLVGALFAYGFAPVDVRIATIGQLLRGDLSVSRPLPMQIERVVARVRAANQVR